MSRLLESIKVEHRRFFNLHHHQTRVNRSLAAIFEDVKINLEKELHLPETLDDRLYKCRVEYDTQIRKVDFLPYFPKSIHTLKLTEADDLDYSFKFKDRKTINHYFDKRGNCDDVLFIKDGLVADTSYCNILFYDGEKWNTPKIPLLQGTKRQQLLDEGRIEIRDISPNDLNGFHYFMLINAMLDFDEERIQPVSNIV